MYIFIDANIYLSYYAMSENATVSLRQLKDYIEHNKKAKLILPIQTQNEFLRNRNRIIKESLEKLNKATDNAVKLDRRYYENKQIKKSVDKIKKELQKIKKRLETYLIQKNSVINTVINSLFEVAIKVEEDESIFNKAYKRSIKGNPPGKKGSVGDAIAWEILLQQCSKEPTYIIARDADWIDEIDNSRLKLFLLLEWQKKSSRKITFFKSIGDYLNKVQKKKISKKVIKEEKSFGLVDPSFPHMNIASSTNYFTPLGSGEGFSTPYETGTWLSSGLSSTPYETGTWLSSGSPSPLFDASGNPIHSSTDLPATYSSWVDPSSLENMSNVQDFYSIGDVENKKTTPKKKPSENSKLSSDKKKKKK